MRRIILASLLALSVAACASDETSGGGGSGGGAGGGSGSINQQGLGGGGRTGVDASNLGALAENLRQTAGDRVFFDYDSSTVNEQGREVLQRQAAWLKQYPNVRFTVEGHADERGTREYNLALGERRAQAVKDYLMSLGIAESRLVTISYGKERPAVAGSNEAAWSQNRRGVSVPAF